MEYEGEESCSTDEAMQALLVEFNSNDLEEISGHTEPSP